MVKTQIALSFKAPQNTVIELSPLPTLSILLSLLVENFLCFLLIYSPVQTHKERERERECVRVCVYKYPLSVEMAAAVEEVVPKKAEAEEAPAAVAVMGKSNDVVKHEPAASKFISLLSLYSRFCYENL